MLTTSQDVSSLYLTTKFSAYPNSPRSIVNVYAYLVSLPASLHPIAEKNAEA